MPPDLTTTKNPTLTLPTAPFSAVSAKSKNLQTSLLMPPDLTTTKNPTLINFVTTNRIPASISHSDETELSKRVKISPINNFLSIFFTFDNLIFQKNLLSKVETPTTSESSFSVSNSNENVNEQKLDKNVRPY